MNGRARRAAIFLPIVVTVIVAVVIGALVIQQDQRQADQVSAAETVGNDYLREVAAFRSRVIAKLNEASSDDPAKLAAVVDEAIKDPPQLGETSGYGGQRADAYVRARAAQAALLKPYQDFSASLRRADVALDFINAARKVLAVRASDYIGFAPLSSSGPIRSALIPAFVRARDEFLQVRVPPGQDELAATVRDAVQYVINQATTLASRIESQQSFSFTYGTQFQAAAAAVDDYATTVKGDIAEAINTVTEQTR